MRIINIYAYLRSMKTRLNLTIDNDLLLTIKSIAHKKQTSVSELVEEYFKVIARPSRRKNILQLVDTLPDTKIDKEADLKDLYYKSQSEKHGF